MRLRLARQTLAVFAVLLIPALAGAAPRTEEHASASQVPSRRIHAVPGPASVPRTPEQRAIQVLREDSARRVHALTLQILAISDHGTRRALHVEVCNVKRETRVAELRALRDFAARRGDVSAARRIADQLDRMLHPRLSVAVPESRKPAVERGDRP